MAKLIPADNDLEISEITINSLEDMQKAVGGYIEAVYHDTTRQKCLLVNEEGLILGLHVNTRASLLYGYPLAGDVLEVSIPSEFN